MFSKKKCQARFYKFLDLMPGVVQSYYNQNFHPLPRFFDKMSRRKPIEERMGILILIRLEDLMINVYSLSTIYTWNIVNIFWNKEPPSPSSMFQEKGCPFSCIDVTFFFFNKYPKIYSVVFWMLQIRQFSHDLHGIVTQYVTILKSCLFIHFIRLCRLTFLYSRMYRVQRIYDKCDIRSLCCR